MESLIGDWNLCTELCRRVFLVSGCAGLLVPILVLTLFGIRSLSLATRFSASHLRAASFIVSREAVSGTGFVSSDEVDDELLDLDLDLEDPDEDELPDDADDELDEELSESSSWESSSASLFCDTDGPICGASSRKRARGLGDIGMLCLGVQDRWYSRDVAPSVSSSLESLKFRTLN